MPKIKRRRRKRGSGAYTTLDEVAEWMKISREEVVAIEISAIQKIAIGIWDAVNDDPILRSEYGHLLGPRPMEPEEMLEHRDLFDEIEED